MKNIISQTALFLVLFTFIGCEQSPISPIVETEYSITTDQKTGTEFISNTKTVPLDSVLSYLALNDTIVWMQETRIKRTCDHWNDKSMRAFNYYNRQLKVLSEKYSKLVGAQNKNDKKIIIELNKKFISEQDSLINEHNFIVLRNRDIMNQEITNELNESQKLIWEKWVSSGKIGYRWNPIVLKSTNIIGS